MQQAVGINVVISVAESAGGNGGNRADLALMAGDVVIAGWPSLLYRPLRLSGIVLHFNCTVFFYTSYLPYPSAYSHLVLWFICRYPLS